MDIATIIACLILIAFAMLAGLCINIALTIWRGDDINLD